VKRTNEFAVGAAILGALVVVIAGALWLSGTDLRGDDTTYSARFRTVDGLQVGNPVTLRGVRVGKVVAVRLIQNEWVEADFAIETRVDLPARPAVIAASASLFGGWSANIISFDPLPDDPNVRAALIESDRAGGDAWPGATLPDIGQLTAQASRIAGDVAEVTNRIQGAFDSTALREFRQSVLDLAGISSRLVTFTQAQAARVDRVGADAEVTANAFANVARNLDQTVARIDSATRQGQFNTILNNGAAASTDLRTASADFRSLMTALQANQASLVHVVSAMDSLMTRMQAGQGTLGLLATDSTLYRETTETMRQFRELMADFQAHPRKYIKVSVF
jgi:phospholipid/cholesterol/gamma-HCH transport system substrate-binding protein